MVRNSARGSSNLFSRSDNPTDLKADVLEQASLVYVHVDPCCHANEALPWLRIDYDPRVAGGVLHAPCHLHVHGAPTVRIPVDRVPTPRAFVEAIAAWFYPQLYAKHRTLDAEFWPAEFLADDNAFLGGPDQIAKASRLIFAMQRPDG